MCIKQKIINCRGYLSEKISSNFILWIVDLSIGSLPLLIKMFIVNNMAEINSQFQSDWLILFLVITIASFFRCISSKTNNRSCVKDNMNETVGLILHIMFIYTLSFTIVLYVSELIGFKMIHHYWKCVGFNIFFSFTCTIITPQCNHVNNSQIKS
jgi:hypothetical protein